MTTSEEPRPVAPDEDETEVTLSGIALTAAIEAMLFVSDEGLSAERMAAVAAVTVDAVRQSLMGLSSELTSRSSGLALREFSSGWRLTTAPGCAPLLERFVVEGQSGRLSPAALETLAVVAYRQPVSRGRIAAIRGVAVDGVVRTLLNRGLLHEVGTEPSGAVLYGVTELFLDKLGIASVTDLPSLAPLLPELETMDELNDQMGRADDRRLALSSPPADLETTDIGEPAGVAVGHSEIAVGHSEIASVGGHGSEFIQPMDTDRGLRLTDGVTATSGSDTRDPNPEMEPPL